MQIPKEAHEKKANLGRSLPTVSALVRNARIQKPRIEDDGADDEVEEDTIVGHEGRRRESCDAGNY